MTNRPTTAIIGAGVSGLTAGKNLADYDIPYECFETSDRIGGNWAFGNPNGHSSAYRSLHIDTSKERVSFLDFPIPSHFPDFPHHTQIHQYLEDYAAHFGLKERIHFHNGVVHAEHLDGGGWELETQDGKLRRFDALVVGNGHHWDPRYPDFPGTFDGETIHSHHYIEPTAPLDLRDKRIVVVGIGNSAADIVSEISQKIFRNDVILSTRSGAWVMPKYVFGRPIDQIAPTLPGIPLAWQRKALRYTPRLIAGNPERYGLPKPDHHFLEAHATLSNDLLARLGAGDARVKPNIERLDGDTVHFVDGTSEQVDVIIYATGYNISFPFFDPEFLSAPGNKLPLYKRMLKPGMDDLVFVGFGQALPTLFPFIESQVRLLARYLAGTYRPPVVEEMERVIAADAQLYGGSFADRPRHTQQVDYYHYERQMRTRELPEGRRRAEKYGAVELEGRALAADLRSAVS